MAAWQITGTMAAQRTAGPTVWPRLDVYRAGLSYNSFSCSIGARASWGVWNVSSRIPRACSAVGQEPGGGALQQITFTLQHGLDARVFECSGTSDPAQAD